MAAPYAGFELVAPKDQGPAPPARKTASLRSVYMLDSAAEDALVGGASTSDEIGAPAYDGAGDATLAPPAPYEVPTLYRSRQAESIRTTSGARYPTSSPPAPYRVVNNGYYAATASTRSSQRSRRLAGLLPWLSIIGLLLATLLSSAALAISLRNSCSCGVVSGSDLATASSATTAATMAQFNNMNATLAARITLLETRAFFV
jgi:hypothetical protein